MTSRTVPESAATNDVKALTDGSLPRQELDGHFETPAWVCDVLEGTDREISRMQISQEEQQMYSILHQYFIKYATTISGGTGMNTDNSKCGDRLSSLFLQCLNFQSDEEDDRTNKIKVPYTPIYGLGSCAAQIMFEGAKIAILHLGTGPPAAVCDTVTVFRSMHLFARKQRTLKRLVDVALNSHYLNRPHKPGTFQLYVLAGSCGQARWVSKGLKQSRPFDSIILPPGMLDSIINDVKHFSKKQTKDWYFKHGLPHRRSYLFYGTPGTGKTSTIRAMAGVLNRSVCFLSLGTKSIGNEEIIEALYSIPKPSILVIEDIDALFNKARKTQNESDLTFSGLLNALDGLVAANAVVTVMTTNHLERLDPAMIRAGRVDRRFEFKLPSDNEIKQLFRSFYPEAKEELVVKFADAVISRPEKEACSIATLQQHFIYSQQKSAEESVELVNKFFTEFFPMT